MKDNDKMGKHAPGPWIDKGTCSTGHEIKAKVARIGDEFITIFHTPKTQDLSLQINEKGEIWALLAYERWIQFPSDNWIEMQKANARLIAAAPDLLEACKGVLIGFEALETLDTKNIHLDRMRAAIAKAEEPMQ
jgi:hypothetical protein